MSNPKIVALITAKGGNQSLENKNLIKINGKESVLYSVDAAKQSKWVSHVFVSTEDPRIAKTCESHGSHVISRPLHLSQPLTNHGDVISHAYDEIIKVMGKVDIVVVLLGNTVMTSSKDIDMTVEALIEDKNASSSMTVWVAQDDHPMRALKMNEGGYLESYLPLTSVDTNRQSYPEVLFYDQGPWTVRATTIETSMRSSKSPGPWWWMGEKSIPIKREWITGRDTHSHLDLAVAEWWLSRPK